MRYHQLQNLGFLDSIYLGQLSPGAPAGKRPLGRPRRRWKDNFKMDLKEIGINTRNWVYLARDRNYWRARVNVAFNLRVP